MRKPSSFLLLLFTFSAGWFMPGSAILQTATAQDRCTESCNCPSCGEECYLDVSESKEKRHCWNIETKKVCVPPVQFYWAGCPAPTEKLKRKPARTKTVRVLKKKEYECPKCKYEWKQLEIDDGDDEASDPADAAKEDGNSDKEPNSCSCTTECSCTSTTTIEFDSTQAPAQHEYVQEYKPAKSELAPIVSKDGIQTESYVPNQSWQGEPTIIESLPSSNSNGTLVPLPAGGGSTSRNIPQYQLAPGVYGPRIATPPRSVINSTKQKYARQRLTTAGRSSRNARR